MAWSLSNNPIDYQPPQPAQPAAPKSSGSTGFWQRIGMVGIGKVNLLNAYRSATGSGPTVNSDNSIAKNAGRDVVHATAATGRFLFSNATRMVNQGYQEGRQAVDAVRNTVDTYNTGNAQKEYEAARRSGDKSRIAAASAKADAAIATGRKDEANQNRDYKGFNKKGGGLLNVGTFSSEKSAKQGSLKQGAQDIGGGTLAAAADVVPFAKLTKGAKVYKATKGLVEADRAAQGASKTEKAVSLLKNAGKQAAVGGTSSAAATAGSQEVQNGKVNWGDVAKSGAEGALLGGGATVAGHLLKGAAGTFKTAVTKGPKAALAELKSKAPSGGMQDVMTSDQAKHVAGQNREVVDKSTGATKINVRNPKLIGRGPKGYLPSQTESGKGVHLSTRTTPESPKTIPVSDKEYTHRSNAIAQSFDTKSKQAVTDLKNAPAIDGYHTSDQFAKDYADHLRGLDSGAKGGQLQKTTDGGYIRTTEHTPFYSQYYKENGRAPSKAAYHEEAIRQLESGKADMGASDTYKQLQARESQAVEKVTQEHQAMHDQLDHEYMNGKPNPDYKPAETHQTGFVMGKKATATATKEATAAQTRIRQIDTIIQKAQQKGTGKSAEQMRALMRERKSLEDTAAGKTAPKEAPKAAPKSQAAKFKAAAQKAAPKPSKQAAKVRAAAASTTERPVAETSAPVRRPVRETPPTEEKTFEKNRPAKKSLLARVQNKAAGAINPEIAAARQGHTVFAKALRKVASGDIMSNYTANRTASKFEKLYKDYLKNGGSKEQFIKDIESGNGDHAAHKFWVQHYQDLGNKAVDAGVMNAKRDSKYFARSVKFDGGKNPNAMGGLKKTGGFTKGRAQLMTDEFGNGGDLYKTHAEFKAAVEKNGGKVLDDPVQLMKQTTAARLKAINHAQGLEDFANTKMGDGREAVITFNQKEGLPANYRDYNQTLLPGRAVHPDAVKGIESLVKVSSFDQLSAEHALSKFNSISKRLVTLNGLVHGKNFVLASIREQGLRGTALAFKQFSEDDVNRAIKNGFAPSRAGMVNVFDEATNGKNAWGNAITKALGGAREKMDKALFEGFGDKLGMHTYLNVEKGLIARGIPKEEAGKIAADTANRVLFSGRASSSSAGFREAGRLAFFAGKFFQSTMQIATKATGLAKDNTLSAAAQKAEQRQAAMGAARGFAYMFAAAQALNYATTGHSTFQNKDSKISPVFYVDKSTGKQYHITNWYGQLGELLNITNPKTLINKLSPAAQETVRLISNKDSYTGQQIRDTNASGFRQDVQMLANALDNMVTPLGFQFSGVDKVMGSGKDPSQVSAAKLLGYGSSSKDQTRMEKEIDSKFYASLPQGQKSDAGTVKLEAAARHDIATGNKNSPNVQKLKTQMSTPAFNKFVKEGGSSDTQRHFDSLSTQDKLAIIQKYSPDQLKELNLDGVVKTLTTSKQTVQTLNAKGLSDQQIQQAMQKAGYNSDQIRSIYQNAKKATSQADRTARRQPKWKSPLL